MLTGRYKEQYFRTTDPAYGKIVRKYAAVKKHNRSGGEKMSLVMLIDDDTDMLKLTERWIIKAGHETLCASSGAQALELLKTARPDVIILDYAMPEMDGPAVYKAVKADDGTKDIPVIFRTGKEDSESESILSGLSPAGVVPKSEGKPGLLGILNDVMK